MEANVDVQKLQILNDRITQALEALDQVRLSVHGISHTPALDPWTTQQMQARTAYAGAVPYSLPFGSVQSQVPAIQHSIPTPTFFPTFGTVPTQVMGPLWQQPGLLHANPEFIQQQRMVEARYGTDPVRLSQTFPFLNVPRVVPTIW